MLGNIKFTPTLKLLLFFCFGVFLINIPIAWGISRTTYRTEEGATVGPNIVVNGSFDADSNWTKPTGGTISDGKANWTQNGLFRQNVTLDADSYYEFIYTVSDYAHGAIRVQGWTQYSVWRYSPATFRDIIYFPTGSSAIFITASDTFTGSVSNITVRKITAGTANWNPRNVAITGDSIAQHQAIAFPDTFPGNQSAGGFSLASSGITPLDYALGNQTFAWVLSTGIPNAIASGARTIIIHAGVNDISTGRTWEQVLSDLNAIRALVTTQDLFIDEILPWTNGDDSQAVTVRTWNANLAIWCAENNAHLISSHDIMGQIRASTGQLDDLLDIYDTDGVHPNTSGNYVLWSLWLDALEEYYGVPIKPNWFITASAGTGGTLDSSGTISVNEGTNRTFTITPNAQYNIADVLIDGVSVGAVDSYTFTDVTADHTISASFELNDNTAPITTDNTDVQWHNSNVNITLSCSDTGGTGCANTYYTTDGTTPTTGSSQGTSISISTDGNYTIKYLSVDNASNEETVKIASNTVKLDKTNPSSIGAPTFGTITISSIQINKPTTATETGSGLYQWQTRRNSATELGLNATTTASVTDSSLSENTQYTYDAQFNDSAGNTSSYGTTASKYTLADTPTGFSASDGTNSISLTVDSFPNDTAGQSGYYFSRSGGGNSGWIQANSWTDTGLSCGTSYTYSVIYSNGDGATTSPISLTKSTTACSSGGGGGGGAVYPAISQVSVSAITPTAALISWKTDYNTNSEVNYGTSTVYGLIQTDNTKTTTHAVALANLAPATVYQFLVKNNLSGISVSSGNFSFTTLNPSAPSGTASGSGSPTSPSAPVSTQLKLVNDNGTLYLLQNGQRKGITSPGILYSYGLDFKDAKPATAEDLTAPADLPLSPGNGSLVKSGEDATVYLISQNQRHAFASAEFFLGLGFKWQSVLTVTNPELQALLKGTDIAGSNAAHFEGTDIVDNGTIYLIYGQSRLGYPNPEIYNSWHIDNDFSNVVPANAADLALPVGSLVEMRVVE